MLNNIRNSANRKCQNPRAVKAVTGVFARYENNITGTRSASGSNITDKRMPITEYTDSNIPSDFRPLLLHTLCPVGWL